MKLDKDQLTELSNATGMPMSELDKLTKRGLTPIQKAVRERTFYVEYRRRTKAGEPAPFAGMMAARAQLIERNRIMDAWTRLGEV
jgi:hypothetical protein